MNKNEAARAVHSAFYRIVRTAAAPMNLTKFFDAKIEDTWPDDNSPSGWRDFWWESVAVEIQSAAAARREYILGFGRKWLKQNKARKWSAVLDHMRENLVPLS
ncbi:MAG: hypothetical protein AAF628_26755 [Planctomycetota bacterium]